MKYNADQATMLYGYGGFGVPIDPFYDPGFIFFIQNGGVIAVPGIRGGGENGEAWHQARRIPAACLDRPVRDVILPRGAW